MRSTPWVIPFVSLIAFAAVAFAGEPIRLSEPVASDAHSETFGAAIDGSLEQYTLAELMERATELAGKPVQVETRIAQVCQKKGCFFIAQQGPHAVRVAFKDYSFFIPTDSADRTVTLVGELIRTEISDERARHLAADLGDSDRTIDSGVVYEIIASAVRIPRAG